MSAEQDVAYMHAYAHLTEEQLVERREFYKERYYETLDQLEAIDTAVGALSQLIRDRRHPAGEAGTEAVL